MKTLKFFLTAVLAVTLSSSLMAQMNHSQMAAMKTQSTTTKTTVEATKTGDGLTKTETIKVSGKCGMCKTRIEKAAKLEGVSKAEWDQKTNMLTLTYDSSKVKSDDIQKKIAAVGHDTPNFKATDKVYNALPGCCKYRTK